MIDADGTVIFTHRVLTGRSALTRKKAAQHGKPVPHLNLAKVTEEDAVQILVTFIEAHDIQVLNVAGSRGSSDPALYDKVFKIMDGALLNTQPLFLE